MPLRLCPSARFRRAATGGMLGFQHRVAPVCASRCGNRLSDGFDDNRVQQQRFGRRAAGTETPYQVCHEPGYALYHGRQVRQRCRAFFARNRKRARARASRAGPRDIVEREIRRRSPARSSKAHCLCRHMRCRRRSDRKHLPDGCRLPLPEEEKLFAGVLLPPR